MTAPALPLHRLRSRRPLTTPDPLPGDRAPEPAPDSDAARAAALAVEVEQMRSAMASRARIEQAKGILMLLTGCTDQVAFDLLSHISGHTHRKVRDVAQAITGSACGSADLPDDIRAILHDACPPGAARH
jgi:hypothetical protein